MSVTKALSLLILSSIIPASAAGIRVRFLASPPEDSVVRYDVWRCDSAGAASAKVGSLAAGSAEDTLAFPDSTARKGVAYLYSLRAVNAAGLESDPSDSSRVALPRLALPDTARPSGGLTRLLLAPEAHPLEGHAPLLLSLADSSRIRLVHDTLAGAIHFLSLSGRPDTVTAVVRASYHGKFSDQDTLLVMTGGRLPTGLLLPRPGTPPAAPSLSRASGSGALLVAVPARGRVRLYGPDGRLVPSR